MRRPYTFTCSCIQGQHRSDQWKRVMRALFSAMVCDTPSPQPDPAGDMHYPHVMLH